MYSNGVAIEDVVDGPAVLVVEDERVSRRALTALLDASGYSTEAVGSAEDALQTLKGGRNRTPEVALIDLNLPGMSGLDLIDRLRQLAPTVFPVLITATSAECLAKAIAGRDLAYIRKPLNFDHLLKVIEQHSERH